VSSKPSTWAECQIGDVCKVVGGGTPPSHDESNFTAQGGMPWITPADLSGYREKYIERGRRNLTSAGLANSSAKVIPAGTVLFSSRAPVGYVAIAANEVATNQGFKSFLVPDGFDSSYLYYYLRYIKPEAEARATGTTFKELSGSAAAKLPLLVAPSREQSNIARKLDTVLAKLDACRERLERVPQILKKFREAVLEAAVSGRLTEEWRGNNPTDATQSIQLEDESVDVPATWRACSLEEAIDANRPLCYGVVQPGESDPSGAKLIRIQDMDRGLIAISELRTVSRAIDEEYRRSRVRAGDLLVSVVGTIGRTAIVPEGLVANIARAIARIAPADEIDSRWLRIWLESVKLQWWLLKSSKEVARKTLNLGDLAKAPLALPPVAEQAEIIRRVDELFARADGFERRYDDALTRVELLTPSVLAKAFRGELVPQDPNDEPAGEMLARIQTHMEVSVGTKKKARITPRAGSLRVTNPSNDILNAVQRLKKDHVTAGELRAALSLDYETFKDALFDLLTEKPSRLKQVFDEKRGEMLLSRVK
jgi:type I restriction enzyme, S subunit